MFVLFSCVQNCSSLYTLACEETCAELEACFSELCHVMSPCKSHAHFYRQGAQQALSHTHTRDTGARLCNRWTAYSHALSLIHIHTRERARGIYHGESAAVMPHHRASCHVITGHCWNSSARHQHRGREGTRRLHGNSLSLSLFNLTLDNVSTWPLNGNLLILNHLSFIFIYICNMPNIT